MVHPQPEHPPIQIRAEVFHGLYYCQELFPGGAAILLGSGKNLAIVSDDHLSAILDLRQYGTHIVVASISVQNILPGGVGIRQNRCSFQATFEAVERLLFSLGPLPVDPLCGESI